MQGEPIDYPSADQSANVAVSTILAQPAGTCHLPTHRPRYCTLPVEIWNEISMYDMHTYYALAQVIRGLNCDVQRRKSAFAVLTDHRYYSILTLNGKFYCDERPAYSRQLTTGELKLWISPDSELHRTDGPAVLYGDYEEFHIYGVHTRTIGNGHCVNIYPFQSYVNIQKFLEYNHVPLFYDRNTSRITTERTKYSKKLTELNIKYIIGYDLREYSSIQHYLDPQ